MAEDGKDQNPVGEAVEAPVEVDIKELNRVTEQATGKFRRAIGINPSEVGNAVTGFVMDVLNNGWNCLDTVQMLKPNTPIRDAMKKAVEESAAVAERAATELSERNNLSPETLVQHMQASSKTSAAIADALTGLTREDASALAKKLVKGIALLVAGPIVVAKTLVWDKVIKGTANACVRIVNCLIVGLKELYALVVRKRSVGKMLSMKEYKAALKEGEYTDIKKKELIEGHQIALDMRGARKEADYKLSKQNIALDEIERRERWGIQPMKMWDNQVGHAAEYQEMQQKVAEAKRGENISTKAAVEKVRKAMKSLHVTATDSQGLQAAAELRGQTKKIEEEKQAKPKRSWFGRGDKREDKTH